MNKILKYRNWRLLNTGSLSLPEMKDLFDAIQEGAYTDLGFLKDHHRSKVRRIRYKGKELVVKTPLEKNRRLWIRFTTLFRKGEAFKNIKGMQLLALQHIPSTLPVMAAECRRFGMVTDSWLVYEYLDGISCFGREEHFPAVVALLKEMHDKGILHGDSQLQNFLFSGGRVRVIDANPKPVRTPFQTAYEFAYLRKSWPAIETYFGAVAGSSWYRIARRYLAFDRGLARMRRSLKRLAGIRPKTG